MPKFGNATFSDVWARFDSYDTPTPVRYEAPMAEWVRPKPATQLCG